MKYKITVTKHGIGWYKNNLWYRENGPAWECADGNRSWYKNNQSHRLDGPALECSAGLKQWWIDGAYYTEEEFNKEIKAGKI